MRAAGTLGPAPAALAEGPAAVELGPGLEVPTGEWGLSAPAV